MQLGYLSLEKCDSSEYFSSLQTSPSNAFASPTGMLAFFSDTMFISAARYSLLTYLNTSFYVREFCNDHIKDLGNFQFGGAHVLYQLPKYCDRWRHWHRT